MDEETAETTAWYNLTIPETAEKLQVDPAQGLSATEAASRLEQVWAK